MTNYRRLLTTDLNSHFNKICLPYQCRKSLLSYGVWNSLLNMIEIIHQHRSAAKCFLSMGIMKYSKLYIYPEEAIFMMQSSLLQVSINHLNNIPLALDEAYSLCFNQSVLPIQHLHVYQYLTRIGFILIRHRSQTTTIIENKEGIVSSITNSIKRKRDEYEHERDSNEITEEMIQDETYICPVIEDSEIQQFDTSSDNRRSWFPNYTANPTLHVDSSPRLIFPDKFSPVHIDWLPSDFNSKVSQVQLSIYQNNTLLPRPSYSLLRSSDLRSHSTIYQRLSSFASHSHSSNQSLPSNPFFDMYTPRKHFRKSQPDLPDYYLQIKNGNEEFHFEEFYHQTKTLTAIVHNGDIAFYSFKSFDSFEALQ